MSANFWGGFSQGLAGGMDKSTQMGREKKLRDMMLGQQQQQPLPMQIETEPGDMPMGLQLSPAQQPNFLQQLLRMFGG